MTITNFPLLKLSKIIFLLLKILSVKKKKNEISNLNVYFMMQSQTSQ